MNIENIENYYVHQHHLFALGNFVMCTPAIKSLSDFYGKPINVLFDTKVVEQMYEKCEFINIIHDKGNKEMIFESSLVNIEIPDYQFIHNTVLNKLNIPLCEVPNTYVDSYEKPSEIPFDDYCLIIRGANHLQDDKWKSQKDIGDDVYNNIISQINLPIVFIGCSKDYKYYISKMCDKVKDPIIILDDIKKSLGAITHAKYIIANDTGVYHASGALDKDLFVMWKNTAFVKNQSPGNSIKYSMKDNWLSDFSEWKEKRNL
jgi:hypothetical protein